MGMPPMMGPQGYGYPPMGMMPMGMGMMPVCCNIDHVFIIFAKKIAFNFHDNA